MFALPPKDMEVNLMPTLDEMWKTNKTLIISYADKSTVRDNPWLWHPIDQYWGDTTKVSVLREFLEKTMRNHNPVASINPFWAVMAELTPQPIDVIFRTNGLRKLANDVNGKLTKWYRDQWGRIANIVATDYFLGNDLIYVSIRLNT